MICIPITARSTENTISEMSLASKYADIIELRIDYITELQDAETCIERSLKSKTKPVIITNRPEKKGANLVAANRTDYVCYKGHRTGSRLR